MLRRAFGTPLLGSEVARKLSENISPLRTIILAEKTWFQKRGVPCFFSHRHEQKCLITLIPLYTASWCVTTRQLTYHAFYIINLGYSFQYFVLSPRFSIITSIIFGWVA